MISQGMKIRQSGQKNVQPERKENIQIINDFPGIVHYIIDEYGNDYIFPGDDDTPDCIVKQPGKLTFYKKDGQNCLCIITEYGAISVSGEVIKQENNFITFKSNKYKIILERDDRMIESAILAEWNFIAKLRAQQRVSEFRTILADAIRDELRQRGLNVPPNMFLDDKDDNGDAGDNGDINPGFAGDGIDNLFI